MATVLNKVDAVIVGFGWAGAIMAKELTEAGLHVVALERGPMQDTYPEGSYPQVIDELTYSVRKKLFVDVSKETVTVRHSVNDVALPNRQLGAFLPGKGVGARACTGRVCTSGSTPSSCACAATMKSATGARSFPKA